MNYFLIIIFSVGYNLPLFTPYAFSVFLRIEILSLQQLPPCPTCNYPLVPSREFAPIHNPRPCDASAAEGFSDGDECRFVAVSAGVKSVVDSAFDAVRALNVDSSLDFEM